MYFRSQLTQGLTQQRRGFTIMEMVVATFLAALLAVLLAAAAATFVRPAGDVDGRTRLALEASMAAEALARDLSGYLADNSFNPGTLTQYKFSNWVPGSGSLVLNYQSSPPPAPAPATVSVTYVLGPNNTLVRSLSYPLPSEPLVVASHVASFNTSLCNLDGTLNSMGSYLNIAITLTYPDPPSTRLPSFTGTYVLIGVQPPP